MAHFLIKNEHEFKNSYLICLAHIENIDKKNDTDD